MRSAESTHVRAACLSFKLRRDDPEELSVRDEAGDGGLREGHYEADQQRGQYLTGCAVLPSCSWHSAHVPEMCLAVVERPICQ